jgi:hypothetical protein
VNTLLVKRTVLAGIAALAIVAAGLGVVDVQQMSAATPTATTDGPGDRAAMHDKMQAEVAKNLSDAKNVTITAGDLQTATDKARSTLGVPDRAAGGWQGHPGGAWGGRGGFLKPAADVLKLTPEELQQKVQGTSLNAVADNQKDAVATALTNAEYDRIAKESQQDPNNTWSSDQVSHARTWAADRIKILMARVWTPRQKSGGFDQRGPQQQTGGFGPRGFHQQADGFQFQQRGPRF